MCLTVFGVLAVRGRPRASVLGLETPEFLNITEDCGVARFTLVTSDLPQRISLMIALSVI
eukprot:gene7908-biopygen14409